MLSVKEPTCIANSPVFSEVWTLTGRIYELSLPFGSSKTLAYAGPYDADLFGNSI